MGEVPYMLLYSLITLVIGGFLGLSYSYKKYTKPYVEKKLDPVALACSIIGGLIFPINLPLSLLFLGFPFGMRPGYGQAELSLGIILAFISYILIDFQN